MILLGLIVAATTVAALRTQLGTSHAKRVSRSVPVVCRRDSSALLGVRSSAFRGCPHASRLWVVTRPIPS